MTYEEEWIYFNRITCGSSNFGTNIYIYCTNKRLIEEQIINSAKKYAFSDNEFFKTFINAGDEKIIYKDDLLNSGLINSKDIEKLDGFVGVKVELLDEDKFNYVVMYDEI